ncbi:hypothetical protein Nepgr_014072 [Nepenthes gracilis]|uniref:Cell division control protein n=1 Tax=Nepenthes gracilis TaxID=150966 RepID=A0AAD3SKB5_NEPGR|nr:hypothetical protein Nepgr_014072 [Nepenthes gracilis]
MPTIADGITSVIVGQNAVKEAIAVKMENPGDIKSVDVHTPPKRKLRSHASTAAQDSAISPPPSQKPSPAKWKSPRRCFNGSPNSSSNGLGRQFSDKLSTSRESPLKKSSEVLFAKSKWNPRDCEQMRAVKEALHVSTAQSRVVCREDEYSRALEFCKSCMKLAKSGSLYICGCPGTGKTMIMEKVKLSMADWGKEASVQQPDVLSMNCTSLTNPSEVFCKIVQKIQPQKNINGSIAALNYVQNLYSGDGGSSSRKMLLLIIDELDYLITKDCSVLHELFMLTTLPFSRCVLIGIANRIDLANRFLPRLESLNCKPTVLTFHTYSKDQILKILQERLLALPYTVFQPQALELCARKVAAASGDMRKALCICRSAIVILEAEIKQNMSHVNMMSEQNISFDLQDVPASQDSKEIDIVQVDHMAAALSNTYRSPTVETIQSLPQHQQIILCSTVKLFRGGKKATTIGELNKSYEDMCKSLKMRPVGISELSSMCRVLSDQGLLKFGQFQKIEKVSLKVDVMDITFALQGVRFFRSCLQ